MFRSEVTVVCLPRYFTFSQVQHPKLGHFVDMSGKAEQLICLWQIKTFTSEIFTYKEFVGSVTRRLGVGAPGVSSGLTQSCFLRNDWCYFHLDFPACVHLQHHLVWEGLHHLMAVQQRLFSVSLGWFSSDVCVLIRLSAGPSTSVASLVLSEDTDAHVLTLCSWDINSVCC